MASSPGLHLGHLNDSLSYNGFGELATHRAEAVVPVTDFEALMAEIHARVGTIQDIVGSGSELYPRDALGRITEKVETLGGATTTHAYIYDLAGRLAEVRQDGVVSTTPTMRTATAPLERPRSRPLRTTPRTGSLTIRVQDTPTPQTASSPPRRPGPSPRSTSTTCLGT
jgi:YD repeat-containing protein